MCKNSSKFFETPFLSMSFQLKTGGGTPLYTLHSKILDLLRINSSGLEFSNVISPGFSI